MYNEAIMNFPNTDSITILTNRKKIIIKLKYIACKRNRSSNLFGGTYPGTEESKDAVMVFFWGGG